jgi:hypothetical protein
MPSRLGTTNLTIPPVAPDQLKQVNLQETKVKPANPGNVGQESAPINKNIPVSVKLTEPPNVQDSLRNVELIGPKINEKILGNADLAEAPIITDSMGNAQLNSYTVKKMSPENAKLSEAKINKTILTKAVLTFPKPTEEKQQLGAVILEEPLLPDPFIAEKSLIQPKTAPETKLVVPNINSDQVKPKSNLSAFAKAGTIGAVDQTPQYTEKPSLGKVKLEAPPIEKAVLGKTKYR